MLLLMPFRAFVITTSVQPSMSLCCVAGVDDLVALDDRVSSILASAWASSTLSCRNSQWRKYLFFCTDRGFSALPSELSTIVRFLAYLESLNYKYVTINNYLSSIVVLHRFYGFKMCIRDSYLIQTVLSGLRRRLGTCSTPKLPLSIYQVDNICRLYPKNPHNDCCWLATVICFRTLLRKSNVVVGDSSEHILRREDVTFCSDKVIFRVHTSKTRKKGQETLEIPILRVSNRRFCVYTLLYEHVNIFPVQPDAPLLWKPGSGGNKPLHYRDVSSFLKNCVQLIRLFTFSKAQWCHVPAVVGCPPS